MLTILPYMASVDSTTSQHNGSSSNETEETGVESSSNIVPFVTAPASSLSSPLSVSPNLCNSTSSHTVSAVPEDIYGNTAAVFTKESQPYITPKPSTLSAASTLPSNQSITISPDPSFRKTSVTCSLSSTNHASPIYSSPVSLPVSTSQHRLPLSSARRLKSSNAVSSSKVPIAVAQTANVKKIHSSPKSESVQDISAIQKEIDKYLHFSFPTNEEPMHTSLMRACQVALQLDSLWPCKDTYREAQGRQQVFRVLSTLHPTDDTDSSSSSDEEFINFNGDTASPMSMNCSFNSPGSSTGIRRSLDHEEKYLGRRLRTHSQMQWIQNELMATKCRGSHLHSFYLELLNTRKKLSAVMQPNNDTVEQEVLKSENDMDRDELSPQGCCRVTPYEVPKRSRQSFTTLSCNPNLLLHLNPAFSEPGLDGCRDSRIQCQCRHPETGPCILCLGQCHRTAPLKPIVLRYPWDEASSAMRLAPIDMNIHPIMSSFSDRSLHLDASHRLGNAKYSGRKVHWSQLPWRTSAYFGGVPATVRHQYSFSLSKVECPTQGKLKVSSPNVSKNLTHGNDSALTVLKKRHRFSRKKKTRNLDLKKLLSKSSYSGLPNYRWTNSKITSYGNSQLPAGSLKKYLTRCSRSSATFKSKMNSRIAKNRTRITNNSCIDGPGSLSSSRVGSLLLEALQQRRENMREIPIPSWHLHDDVKGPLSPLDDTDAVKRKLSSMVVDNFSSGYDDLAKFKVERLHKHSEDTSDAIYRAMHTIEKELERERLHHVPVTPVTPAHSDFSSSPNYQMTTQRQMSGLNHEGSVNSRKDGPSSSTKAGCGTAHITRRQSQSVQDDVVSRYKPSSNPGYKILSFPLTSECFSSLRRNELL